MYKRTEFSDGNPALEEFVWKLWVPQGLVQKVLETAHCPPNKSHGGISKTLVRLKKNFYWPKMALDVKTFIKKL